MSGGLLPPPRPAQRPSFFRYAVVDVTVEPPGDPIVGPLENSRGECRKRIEFDPNADKLRIRRVKVILYES